MLPQWLAQKAWEINLERAVSGWQAQFRVYNVVENKSDIVYYALTGNESGMRELLQTRQATPFDVDEIGLGLLEASHTRYL